LLQSGGLLVTEGDFVITRSKKATDLDSAAVAGQVHVLAELLTQQGTAVLSVMCFCLFVSFRLSS
jgi:hypothetical protein